MSNENDQPYTPWEDDNTEDTPPQTFRDAYLDAVNWKRPRTRSDNTPQDGESRTTGRSGNRARSTNVPGDGRVSDKSTTRATRPVRQSRDEVYARLRQRSRQPIYTRDQDEVRDRPSDQVRKSARPMPHHEDHDAYPYHQSVSSQRERSSREIPSGRSAYSGRRVAEPSHGARTHDEYEFTPHHRRRPGRSRRVFSTLLTGCLGGLLTLIVVAAVVVFLLLHNTPLGQNLGLGKSTYTRSTQQVFALDHSTRLIVKNQVGNVSIVIDQNASTASVTGIKRVLASSQSEANSQFNGMTLSTKQIGQGADTACTAGSCLLISTTVPLTGTGGLLSSNNGDAIDLAITLPASFDSPDPLSPYTINASTMAGSIVVTSFNGILNLTGNVGNIHVTHSLIYAGTCMQTMHGDVTIDQGSFLNLVQSSPLVPCNNTTSNDPHPWFNLRSSVGNVNLTLPSNSTNLLLDANTNDGEIAGDFALKITTDGNSATYHDPLVPDTNPSASLYVATSTGNITIRKQ